jgi:hypothetical protein
MKMAYTGRHIEGTRAKHRNDLQIFGAVLDEHDSAAQGFSQRRIDHDFRRRRGSAVWAMALDVHQTAIATTKPTNALVMSVSPYGTRLNAAHRFGN